MPPSCVGKFTLQPLERAIIRGTNGVKLKCQDKLRETGDKPQETANRNSETPNHRAEFAKHRNTALPKHRNTEPSLRDRL